ncbi:hypothetical protein GCM10027447_21950 [Glycomyces halotolerans]
MYLNDADRSPHHYGAPQTPQVHHLSGESLPPHRDHTAGRTPPQRGHDYEPPSIDDPRPRGKRRTDARLALLLAALASATAGIIHFAAAPAHVSEWPLSGAFFVLSGLFQLGWAILILPFAGRFLAVVGMFANAGLLALWVVTRWRGLPFGPHAGAPEAIGFADTLAAALEAAIIAGALWALLPRERHGVLKAGGYRTVVALAGMAMCLALVPGIDSALSHGGEGHTHGESEGDGHDHDHGTETEEPGAESPTSEPSATDGAPTEAEGHDHTHAPGEEHD